MSVFGIDVGNYACRVGAARSGGIEILTNEYSDRATPSYVALTANERLFGHNALQQQPTNLKSTFYFFKRLLGHRYSDVEVSELPWVEYEVFKGECDSVCVKAEFGGERRTFLVNQIYAMMLARLASSALTSCGLTSSSLELADCVLSVPVFTTDVERRALLECAKIANLNCLRLIPDTTAIALCYGLYHQEMPAPADPARLVAFVDIGYASVQCAVVAFNQGRLKVLGVSYDAHLGGRDFDRLIMNYFRDEIEAKLGVDVSRSKRGWLRLAQQCEKCKKMMSTISNPVPIDVECLVDGNDFHSQMSRSQFEELGSELFERVRRTMAEVLVRAEVEKVDLVEIAGGSTRLPRVKALVQEVFGLTASTTLNADEAVARGCTLMCAILSPNFKVREYKIEDCQPFPVTLSWKGATEDEDTEVEVFNARSTVPMSKMLSFYKSEPLVLDARYSYPNDVPIGESRIGLFRIENIVPDAKGNPSKVKVKVRINRNGILEINQAFLVEDDEDEEKSSAAKSGKTHPLSVVVRYTAETAPDLLPRLVEQEAEMQAIDRKQKERADAKNAVEEYIYDMRDKLESKYTGFVSAEDRDKFMRMLSETENWLMEDEESENCEKSVFVAKLNRLKGLGDPVKRRFFEFTHRGAAFDNLAKQTQSLEKAYNAWAAGTNLQHVSEEEMGKVRAALEEKRKWLFEKQAQAQAVSREKDCTSVTLAMIKQQQTELEKTCGPILSKPAPPPPPPPKNEKMVEDPQEPAAKENDGVADQAMDVD